MMNKADINELRSRLNDFNYQNFAEKRPRTGRPSKLTTDFSRLIEDLDALVSEASKKFPPSQVKDFFGEGKKLFNLRTVAINNNSFEEGKAVFLDAIDIIEQNLLEEERKNQEKITPKPMHEPQNKKRDKKIFVSYYNKKMFDQILKVLKTLSRIDPSMDKLEHLERQQSESLEALSGRIDEIRSCSSAIVCLPASNENLATAGTYIDLGACLAVFPQKTLLIHQGKELPDNIRVKVFKYEGDLSFDVGMELAGEILSILQDN